MTWHIDTTPPGIARECERTFRKRERGREIEREREWERESETNENRYVWMYIDTAQPSAFGVSFLQSQNLIDDLVLHVSFVTFCWKENYSIEIGACDLNDTSNAIGCTCMTWHTHMCDMAHSYVWHDTFICVTWHIHMCDMTHSYVWHDTFICVTWLIHTCDMTHSYVLLDSFICASWLVYISNTTRSYFQQWTTGMCNMFMVRTCPRVVTCQGSCVSVFRMTFGLVQTLIMNFKAHW